MRLFTGLLAAVGICLLVAHPAHAECDRERFVLAIDIGHDVNKWGATSARGEGEYWFNKRFAQRLFWAAQKTGFIRSFIINDADAIISLTQRARIAAQARADLLLSIHHDSMREHLLSEWQYAGMALRYGDQYSGHSLFYSRRNPQADRSRRFATLLGESLNRSGYQPALHHHGVGQRRLENRQLGIYHYDPLILLYNAQQAAVLFEVGVILNRDEEIRLSQDAHQDQFIQHILNAVDRYCAEQQPDRP